MARRNRQATGCPCALRPRDRDLKELAAHADALLLDSGQPHAPIKVLGGTGRVHDWAVSRRIVEAVPCPVFLAGGLRADNVGAAIATVRPFGVDVYTGVRRADHSLDADKLAAFVAAVRAAGGKEST